MMTLAASAARPRGMAAPFLLAPHPAPRRRCACGGSPGLDGACASCRARRLDRQRGAGLGAPAAAPPIVHEALRSPGQPLDAATRAFMEPRFGRQLAGARPGAAGPGPGRGGLAIGAHDDPAEREADRLADGVLGAPADRTAPGSGHSFAQVRVHADARAAASARAVNALAYSVGSDVVFGRGQYAPRTAVGRRLLAHELAHVAMHAERSPGLIRRRVPADVLNVGYTPAMAEELTAEELAAQLDRLQAHLADLAPGSTDYEAAAHNLRVLESVHAARPGAVGLPAPTAAPASTMAAPVGPRLVPRPPGLPAAEGFQLIPATDLPLPPEVLASVPEGRLVTIALPDAPDVAAPVDAIGLPSLSPLTTDLGEWAGQMALGAEVGLLASPHTRPGGLLGRYSPFARPPTAEEWAMLRAGRALHYTPAQNLAGIGRPGGMVSLRPSPGIYRNLLTPNLEPSAYFFQGQPSGVQRVLNIFGRGSLGQQGLVIVEGADLPADTLYRPAERTIVVPRGYRGPGATVAPGGQLPLPLRTPAASGGAVTGEAAAAESAAGRSLTGGATRGLRLLRWGGRVFVAVGIATSIHEVAAAPAGARARTAVGVGGGFVGGLVAGAAAGLVCGPGAPLCSVVFGIGFGAVGGYLGRAGAERIYNRATGNAAPE